MVYDPGLGPPASSGQPMSIAAEHYDAAVFDLDGVITTTAAQHARAWKRLFDGLLSRLRSEAGVEFEPFDIERDYLSLVDGKPRNDAVQAFLAARSIALPYGQPEDEPGVATVCALGNWKDVYFRELLASEGATVYRSSMELLDELRDAGVLVALISASRNTMPVIEAAGVSDRFDAVVEGIRTEQLGLAGKPAPDVFLQAVTDLGVVPERAVAFEDSGAGVAAARSAGFALVIGVERSGTPGRLLAEGAHAEVTDLGEVSLTGRPAPRPARARPSAFRAFEPILFRSRGRRLAVFLDYDGTLTPIVARPALAQLDGGMRTIVRQLAEHALVAVISGRDLADVVQLTAIEGIAYAGSHGFQVRDPGGHEEILADAESFRADLEAAAARLDRELARFSGALVERKGVAVAAHYRQVAERDRAAVRARVEAVAAQAPRLRMTGGKEVIELRPALEWDKGHAVQMLIERWGGRDIFSIYLGDDETDEDAFRALRGRGIGIIVGNDASHTEALYRLDDVTAVGKWLLALHDRL